MVARGLSCVAAMGLVFALACDEGASEVAPRASEVAPRASKVAPRASEAPLPDATCDDACSPGASCCTETFVHGNGSPVGWLRRGAPIPVPVAEGPDAIVAAFKRWLVAHPAVAGLGPMADETPLAGLTPWPTPPRDFRSLTTIRLEQRYRDVEVVGAGETVTLTVSPQHGVIAVHGAIADAREVYAGHDEPISPEAALAAATELLAPLQDAQDELEPVSYSAADPVLVAVVELKAMAHRLRLLKNGEDVGTLLLRADSGAMLDLSFATSSALPEPAPVTVRARTFQSDTYAIDDASKHFVADLTHLGGAPLQGSVYTPLACQEDPAASDQCGETRLGNLEIAVIDARGHKIGDKAAPLFVPTSASGEFLAQPPATKDDPYTAETRAAGLQDAFYRLLATYRLFAPLKAGRWDSLWGKDSGFPADEFMPRIVYFFDVAGGCPDGAPGCASGYFPSVKLGGLPTTTYDEHPWTDLPAHRPAVGPDEAMGQIILDTESFRSVDLLFHEFGHILDIFSFRYTIGAGVIGSGCAGAMDTKMCQPACVLDSTDESEPLKETVADFMGLYAIGRLYTGLTYDSHCGAVSQIASTGKPNPVHGPTCVADASQIRSFLDERPTQPGYVPTEDGPIPTGKCSLHSGYRQGALLNAWWEWTHGQQCATEKPFTCETFGEQAFGASTGAEAMLYALGLTNTTYYRKFLTDAETYLQCVYGDWLGARWREVWCHHGGLDCAAMPSPCPAICGDGVAQGDEACDQDDLAGKTCEGLGLGTGALGCKADCTVDTAQCAPGDAPTTGEAPTTGAVPTSDGGGPPPDPDGASSEPAPDSATAGETGIDSGCGCATTSLEAAWLLGLAPLGWRRRRHHRHEHQGRLG